MKKRPIAEMTSAGSIASVAMPMSEEPIKRAPPKKKASKKQWRNSLHEAQVSEADLAEQDLIITRGMGRKLKPGLMPRQSSHEAVEMALGDLLQCRKNARTIHNIITSHRPETIEPWVAEKIIKANDYLNTVAEYMEGQVAGQNDNMLTFEGEEHLTEIGFANELANLNMPDSEIIQKSKVDGTIGTRDVMNFRLGSSSLYFFNSENKIDALVLLDGDRLAAIKNFSSNKGLIYGLINYIINIKRMKLRINPEDTLSPFGIEWVLNQLSRPGGFKITDLKGNSVDAKKLEKEWQTSRLDPQKRSGPTGLYIGESSSGKKMRDNEKSLMPYDVFGVLINEETKYPEDTWVVCRKNKDGTISYLTKHADQQDAKKTLYQMKKDPDCDYSIEKNPDIPGRKSVDEAKKKASKKQVDEIAPVIGAVAGGLLGSAMGLGRVGTAVARGVGGLAAAALSKKKDEEMAESKLTRGANLLSELKMAEKQNTGYTIVAESYVAELNSHAVKTLLSNYRRAINAVSESAVIKAFGDEQKLGMILEQSGMINEAKDTEKMEKRWSQEMSAMTKEREAGRMNPDNLPPDVLDRIARNPQDREEIIKGYRDKQSVKEARKPKRVPKEDKPYAFGMAAAKKQAGITTKGKPVPKKVITKAHKIAKAIKKDEK